MKTSTIEIRRLTPDEGMVLTNGVTYSKEVFLGCEDSPENWREITEAEYEALMAEQEQQEVSG